MKKYLLLLYIMGINSSLSAQTVTGKLIDQAGSPLSGLQLQLYINPKVYTTSSGIDGCFTFNNITAVKNEQLPTGYSVANNYPNPFNPTTRFEISVPGSASVSVEIFNALGQKVHAITDRVFHAGVNNLDLELNGLPNGFYIARIDIDGKYSVVKKIMLLYGSRHLHVSPPINASMSSNAAILDVKIDSLVVTSSSGRTAFKNLPNLSGSLLNVGNLTISSGAILPGMVAVAGGTFQMGSNDTLDERASPPHTVTVGSFFIDKYEITYEKWTAVATWGRTHDYWDFMGVGTNGHNPMGINNPVSAVTWYDIMKWCNARSEMDGLTPVYYTSSSFIPANIYKILELDLSNTMVNWTANGYRLPTEAEWEFAAKGGKHAKAPTPYIYSGSDVIDTVAWYYINSGNSSHTVGGKMANELGIYDMSGNVSELCWDWYAAYSANAQTDPHGPSPSQFIDNRVLRGGSLTGKQDCRSASRRGSSGHGSTCGFRCVRK